MRSAAPRPGPASTLGETRELLIAAARQFLSETGVRIGLDHLRLADVIAEAGVARATAYRSLAHPELDPQEMLRTAVLERILERQSQHEHVAGIEEAVTMVFALNEAAAAAPDPAVRTRALRSLLRVGAAVSFAMAAASRERMILLAAHGAIASQPDALAYHQDVLRRSERALISRFNDLYGEFAGMFGLRVRSPFTMSQFATASAALLEGSVLRAPFSDEFGLIERATGIDGEVEPWDLIGVALEGLVRMFFEPIDAEAPVADLNRW
jgi:AcrR family transcriptional regulator